jgi:hypothetical protein
MFGLKRVMQESTTEMESLSLSKTQEQRSCWQDSRICPGLLQSLDRRSFLERLPTARFGNDDLGMLL